MDTARQLGVLGGEKGRIGVRIRCDLVAAAKKVRHRLDTELLEYTLAKVALAHDFGPKLVRRKGRVAQDRDFEWIETRHITATIQPRPIGDLPVLQRSILELGIAARRLRPYRCG